MLDDVEIQLRKEMLKKKIVPVDGGSEHEADDKVTSIGSTESVTIKKKKNKKNQVRNTSDHESKERENSEEGRSEKLINSSNSDEEKDERYDSNSHEDVIDNSTLDTADTKSGAAEKKNKKKKVLGLKTKAKRPLKSKKTKKKNNKEVKETEDKTTKKKRNTENDAPQKSAKQSFKEVPPMNFVIDTEKDDGEREGKAIRYTVINELDRERALAKDLFGDVKKKVKGKKKKSSKEASKKRSLTSDIPDDPFDIMNIDSPAAKKKPAWVDEDDVNIKIKDVVSTMSRSRGKRGFKETSKSKYVTELREKFLDTIGGVPDWADLDNKTKDMDIEDDMVRKTGNYLSGKSSVDLPKTTLEYKKMMDLNSSHSEGALIKSINFNPDLQVAIVGGSLQSLGAVSIFQVDGINNHRVHSVRFPTFPITCARFLKDGKKFVVGSEGNSHFFVYDMETSKETKVYVRKKFEKSVDKNLYVNPDGETFVYLDNRGKMYIYDAMCVSLLDILECPFTVTSAAFNSDGTRMYTYGMTGEVCVWDMTSRMCVHRFADEGSIAGDAIAISPNSQYLACGSHSGIVNIYDTSELSSTHPAPVKVLTNLTTPVTTLSFNATSEMLVMASSAKPNAVKLVHFPSMTVFQNFPSFNKELKRILSADFSPHSGYLTIGDTAGAASLFRLKHYQSY